jgi:hypothetical protein
MKEKDLLVIGSGPAAIPRPSRGPAGRVGGRCREGGLGGNLHPPGMHSHESPSRRERPL